MALQSQAGGAPVPGRGLSPLPSSTPHDRVYMGGGPADRRVGETSVKLGRLPHSASLVLLSVAWKLRLEQRTVQSGRIPVRTTALQSQADGAPVSGRGLSPLPDSTPHNRVYVERGPAIHRTGGTRVTLGRPPHPASLVLLSAVV